MFTAILICIKAVFSISCTDMTIGDIGATLRSPGINSEYCLEELLEYTPQYQYETIRSWRENNWGADNAGIEISDWKELQLLGEASSGPILIVYSNVTAETWKEMTETEDIRIISSTASIDYQSSVLAGKYILTEDIHMPQLLCNKEHRVSLPEYEPIGSFTDYAVYNAFSGVFNGNDKKITDLYVNNIGPSRAASGLFEIVEANNPEAPIVTDLALENVVIEGHTSVGAISGLLMNGIIQSISVSGTVRGLEHVGGIVGRIQTGRLDTVRNEATIQTSRISSERVVGIGGVVGLALTGTISNSSNKGRIYSEIFNTGGAAGLFISGTITNFTNEGSISTKKENIGGIAGSMYQQSAIRNSTNKGAILVSQGAGGGILGRLFVGTETFLEGNNNLGVLDGKGDGIGGIIGIMDNGILSQNTNSGTIISHSDNVGGIVGEMISGTLEHNVSLGSLTSETGNNVGGMVGVMHGGVIASGNVGEITLPVYITSLSYGGGIVGNRNMGILVTTDNTIEYNVSVRRISGDSNSFGLISGSRFVENAYGGVTFNGEQYTSMRILDISLEGRRSNVLDTNLEDLGEAPLFGGW